MGCGASSAAPAGGSAGEVPAPKPAAEAPPIESVKAVVTEPAAAPAEPAEPAEPAAAAESAAAGGAAVRAIFDSVDTDGTGSITRSELHAKIKADAELEAILGGGRFGNCYWSDFYEARGREPLGLAMAAYTAAIFCPGAPVDELPGPLREGKEGAAAELSEASASLQRQVARYGGNESLATPDRLHGARA